MTRALCHRGHRAPNFILLVEVFLCDCPGYSQTIREEEKKTMVHGPRQTRGRLSNTNLEKLMICMRYADFACTVFHGIWLTFTPPL